MPAVSRDLIDLACRAADEAGAILMRHWRGGVGMELEPDGSPVTEAGREAGEAIRAAIAAARPDHGVLGAEFGADRPDTEWLWSIDPLDGARSFLHGRASFATLIGLAHRGRYVLGVIDVPALGERWIGADGHGATHNGAPVATRPCASLAEAVAGAVGPDRTDEEDDPLLAPTRDAMRWQLFGLEATMHGLVASGALDLAIDGALDPTDIAAIEPVVRNAGGLLTDTAGNPVDAGYAGRIVSAGDAAAHGALIALLGQGR